MTHYLIGLFALIVWAAPVSQSAAQDDEEPAETMNQVTGEEASVLIYGATRNTGLELAKLLVARGEKVTAVVRPTSDRSGLEPLGVRIVEGDAMDRDSVKSVFAQGPYSAVVTTIACFSCENPPDYEGNANIFDGAMEAGVKRVLLVTTVGAGDSADAPPWTAKWFLRNILPLKTQAETHLISTGADYTIIRPGGLVSKPATGNAYLTEDPSVNGVITRADVAQLLMDCLDDDSTIGKIYTAIDRNMRWPWSMIF